MKCKGKTWSRNLNTFVVNKLKYFKINGQQVLNSKMPAMPKEKASPLPLESDFSDIKMKEQYVVNGGSCRLSATATTTNQITDTNQVGVAVTQPIVVPSPKNEPNNVNIRKYIDYTTTTAAATENNNTTTTATKMMSTNNVQSVNNRAQQQQQPQLQSQTATNNKTPPKKSPNDFIFGKYIGEGSFSTVYLARDVHTNKEYAIKVCDKKHIIHERKQEYVQRERLVMHTMANVPGFVNLYCTFQDKESLYFVMTHAKHGDLLPYINKVGSFDLNCTRHYAAELVLALEEMHKRGILHRDLKPENILLDENMHTMIADFGSAKIQTPLNQSTSTSSSSSITPPPPASPQSSSPANSSPASSETSSPTNDRLRGFVDTSYSNNYRRRKGSFVGTAQYVSPEVLQNSPVSRSTDLWALGCIVYQMISGLPPFRGRTDFFIFREILSCNLVFPEGFDEDAKDLVINLLKLNADERIGAQDDAGHYESIRSHPFFNNINWDTVRTSTPPAIYPYLPGNSHQIELRSQYKVPDNLEPGLGNKQRTRLLAFDLGTSLAEIELNEDDDDDDEEEEEIKTVPQYKYDFPDKEKQYMLEKQKQDDPDWHEFTNGEVILKKGLIMKRKGLFARKRMLLLTTGPKLIYIDPVSMVKKGEIPWSPELKIEPKNFKIFFIHTPKRIYYLEDPEGFALRWVKAINTVRCKTYGIELPTNGDSSS